MEKRMDGVYVIEKEKNSYVISIAEAGAFTVMLRLSDEQYQKAYDNVSSYTKNYIENKYPCGGGGWIQYRVSDEKHVEDIIYLLRIKIS